MKVHFIYIALFISSILGRVNAQCPGSSACFEAEIICSIDALHGFTCQMPDQLNSAFPLPNLCNGSGLAQNISWWAFIGAGGVLSLTFNYDIGNCELEKGLQAGVFEGDCSGHSTWDCNSDCNTSTFTLSGATTSCEVYYIWVDGCEGDWCQWTLSVSGSGGAPQLPPLPPLQTNDRVAPCSEFEVCAPFVGDCEPTHQWFVDGIQQVSRNECIKVQVNEFADLGDQIRVCLTETIGNPDVPGDICDQDMVCTDFRIEGLEKRTAPLLQVPPNQQPFIWNGQSITTDCISPPCIARINKAGFCYDTCQSIQLLFSDSTAVIKGKAYVDLNDNCMRDTGEILLVGANIHLLSQSNQFQTITDSNGCYSVVVPFESYLISATHPVYTIDNCPDSIITLVNEKGKQYCHDFFFQPNDTCEKISIKWIPLTGRNRVRCDPRTRVIQLELFNQGSTDFGPRRLRIDADLKVEWLPSSAYQNISPSIIEFNQSLLLPGEKKRWTLFFKGNCDDINDIGKKVCFSANFTPPISCAGEVVNDEYCDYIRNSFDPNDLTMFPHGELAPRFIDRGETLDGLIRFQNTGTDTAYDIVVDLEMNLSQFQLDAFRINDASADHIVSEFLGKDGKIRFTLKDINLPHEAIDSLGSNGFIRFEIPINPTLPDWTRLEQQALIYFDFNLPIATNIEFQTIAPPYVKDTFKIDLCAGDFYGEMRLTSDTTIIDTLIRPGPDSIQQKEIIVYPIFERTESLHVVLPDTINGVIVIMDTNFTLTLTTVNGCDSIVHYDIKALTTPNTDLRNHEFNFYPNPTLGDFIWIKSNLDAPYQLLLYSLDGALIENHNILQPKQRILTKSLSEGTYIYQIIQGNETLNTGKLIYRE